MFTAILSGYPPLSIGFYICFGQETATLVIGDELTFVPKERYFLNSYKEFKKEYSIKVTDISI